MVRETQNAVNADLKRALGSASIPNIETALNQAELRLNAADKARTEAIVKINRHISAIARAVDTQLKSQARQQEANLSSLRQDTQNANIALTEKLDRIEDDSASAFRNCNVGSWNNALRAWKKNIARLKMPANVWYRVLKPVLKALNTDYKTQFQTWMPIPPR